MMLGGGMMLFFGLLFMLIIIGLPILLIVASVAGLLGPLGRRSGTTASSQGADRQIAPAGILNSVLFSLRPGLADRLDTLPSLWCTGLMETV